MGNSTKTGMSFGKKILLGFAALVIFSGIYGAFIGKEDGNGRSQEHLTKAYVKAKRTLRSNLKDPDSFQEIGHKEYYVSGTDSLLNQMQVIIDYRAKNSFGGMALGKQVYTFDSTGTIIETLDALK